MAQNNIFLLSSMVLGVLVSQLKLELFKAFHSYICHLAETAGTPPSIATPPKEYLELPHSMAVSE